MTDPGLGVASGLSMKLGGAPGLLLAGILGVALLGLAIIVVVRVRPSLLVAITMFLMVFAGNWQYLHIPFGLDDVSAAIAIASAIYRVRSPRHPEHFSLRPIHLLLLLTLAYTTMSALWAGTLTDRSDLFGIISAIGVVPYALFALAPVIFATRRDREILLGGLFVLGVYLGIGAVGEALHVHALVLPSYINNKSIGEHASRVRGPFLEASPEGFALFSTGFAATWVGLSTRRPWLRTLSALVVVLCLIGTFGTVTRAVWIGGTVSAILAMLLTPKVRRYTIPGVLGIAVVVILSLLLVPGLASHASSREGSKRPVWDRLNSDNAALRMFETHPLLGEGWGTFGTKSYGYYEQADHYPITFVGVVHNVYLGRFAELGFLGGGLWLVSLLLALAYALKGRRSGDLVLWRVFAVAVLLNWAVNAALVPLNYAMPNALVWLLLGISSIPVTAARGPVLVPAADPLASLDFDPREPVSVA